MPEPIPAFQTPDSTQFLAPHLSNQLIGYLGDVRDWHGYVKFLSIAALRDTSQDVPLEKLFVEPHLAAQYLSPDAFEGNPPSTEPLTAALAEHPRLVLLGDPGSGKSTVVNFLCTALSRGVDGPLTSIFGGALIPLPFILRELGLGSDFATLPTAEAKWKHLLHLFAKRPVAAQLDDVRRAGVLYDRGLIFQLLERGQAIILLDGIDEIGSLEVRRALRDAFHEGMRRYPRCRWVLTSRIVGYEEVVFEVSRLFRPRHDVAPPRPGENQRLVEFVESDSGDVQTLPLPREALGRARETAFAFGELAATRLYLAPFNDEQVEQFTRLWWQHHESNPHLAGTKPTQFLASLRQSSGAGSLARLPHLLTMIALIYRVIAQLPDGRAKLYGLIAETYLGTLDKERGLEHLRPIPADVEEMTRWLAAIAWYLQRRRLGTQREGGDGPVLGEVLIRQDELVELLSSLIQPKNGLEPEEAARLFVDYAGRRSGLLLPRGEGLYAFLHLSFQEYFASLHLRDQVSDPEWWLEENAGAPGARLADLRAYADDPLWRETLIFLWENAAVGNPKLPERLLVRLLGWKREPSSWGEFPLPTKKQLETPEWRPSERIVLAAAVSVNPHVVLEPALTRRALQERCARWQVRFSDEAYDAEAWPVLNWNEPTRQLLSRPVSAQQVLGMLAEAAVREEAEYLNLAGCTGLSDLAPLSSLSALQQLDLAGCTGLSDLAPLSSLSALQQLDLADCTGLSDLAPLSSLFALQQLDLAGCTRLSDLAPLSSLFALRYLDLASCTWLSDLAPLSSLSALHYLNLTGCTRLTVLAALNSLSALHYLDLDGCTGLSDLAPLKSLSTLQYLDLRDCTGLSDLAPLGSFSVLRQLELAGCTRLSDLAPLSSLSALGYLSLRGCTGLSDLAPLKSLSALQYLDLRDCTGVSDLAPLSCLSALKHIILTGCTGVRREQIERLREALPEADFMS